MPGRYAVVIGINYQNESLAPSLAPEVAERAGLNPLQYAEADAIDMAALLRAEGYLIETLIGAAATRRAIIDIIEQQSDASRNPGDLLVVYFSGHGNVDRYRRPVAYLLPADADPQSLSATAIRLDDLAHHNLSMAHSVLTLLDCCHSGYAVGLKGEAVPDELGQEFGQQARNIFASVRGRIVLAACAGDQQARELRRLRHGAFTYYALEHWRRSPTVNDLNLYEYIDAALTRNGLPRPVRGGVQEGPIVLRVTAPGPSRVPWEERKEIYELLTLALDGDDTRLEEFSFILGVTYKASTGLDFSRKLQILITEMERAGKIGELKQAAARELVHERRRLEEKRRLQAAHEKARQLEYARRHTVLRGIADVVAAFANIKRAKEEQGERENLYSLLISTVKGADIEELYRSLGVEYSSVSAEDDSAKISWLIISLQKTGRLADLKHAFDQAVARRERQAEQAQRQREARAQTKRDESGSSISGVSLLYLLRGHGSEVACVCFAPGGQILASGDRERSIILWRTTDGALLRTLVGHAGAIHSLAFNENGQTLASASSDKTVRLWKPNSATLVRSLPHPQPVYSVVFSPSGEIVATASRDGIIRLWNPRDGRLIRSLEGHNSFVTSLAFGPDGRILASASGDRKVLLWQVSDGRLLGVLEGHTGAVWSVAFAPNGETLASASVDGTVRVWKVGRRDSLYTLNAHKDIVNAVAFAPDSRFIASASNDKTVQLWRAADGWPLIALPAHPQGVASVAFSGTGSLLGSGSSDGIARLWRIAYR